jgi:hypothetical protein
MVFQEATVEPTGKAKKLTAWPLMPYNKHKHRTVTTHPLLFVYVQCVEASETRGTTALVYWLINSSLYTGTVHVLSSVVEYTPTGLTVSRGVASSPQVHHYLLSVLCCCLLVVIRHLAKCFNSNSIISAQIHSFLLNYLQFWFWLFDLLCSIIQCYLLF